MTCCVATGTTIVEQFDNSECQGEPVINSTLEIRHGQCLQSLVGGRQVSRSAECVVDPRPWNFTNEREYLVEKVHDFSDTKCEEEPVGLHIQKLGYCVPVSSDQGLAFMVGCAGGVVTRYWYRSPSVTCRDEEIFATEELVVGLGNSNSDKSAVCGVSPQGYVAESYCTNTIPKMEGASLRLYRDAQCTEFYYLETYEADTCFEFTDSVVVSASCASDGERCPCCACVLCIGPAASHRSHLQTRR